MESGTSRVDARVVAQSLNMQRGWIHEKLLEPEKLFKKAQKPPPRQEHHKSMISLKLIQSKVF